MYEAAAEVGGAVHARNLDHRGATKKSVTFRAASLAPGGATASNLPLYFSCRRVYIAQMLCVQRLCLMVLMKKPEGLHLRE